MSLEGRVLTVGVFIGGSSQVTTQVNVGNNRVILKMAANIAVRAGEIRRRHAPSIRRGLLARDIRRDAIPRKLPHANTGITPLDGHDAAAVCIKLGAKGALVARDAAPGIVVGVLVARLVLGGAGHLALDAHGAVLGRVQRHQVALVGEVGGLHDVNLAVGGPVGRVDEPEGRPGRAAVGGVLDVKDEEAVVVRLFGLDAHAEAAGAGVGFGVWADGGVDFDDGCVCGGVGEVLGVG